MILQIKDTQNAFSRWKISELIFGQAKYCEIVIVYGTIDQDIEKSNQNLYECSTMNIQHNRIFLRCLKIFWKVDIQIKTVFVMWWVGIISDALSGFKILSKNLRIRGQLETFLISKFMGFE